MMSHFSRFMLVGCAATCVAVSSCGPSEPEAEMAEKHMDVKVTAYNAVTWQTKATNPDIAAWGDTLRDGMKAIAVSRDLLKLGLTRGCMVQIEGLDGEYEVLDKMNLRYTRRIDIFMGLDVDSARSWGVRKREIIWKVPRHSNFDKRYQYIPPDSSEVAAAKR